MTNTYDNFLCIQNLYKLRLPSIPLCSKSRLVSTINCKRYDNFGFCLAIFFFIFRLQFKFVFIILLNIIKKNHIRWPISHYDYLNLFQKIRWICDKYHKRGGKKLRYTYVLTSNMLALNNPKRVSLLSSDRLLTRF